MPRRRAANLRTTIYWLLTAGSLACSTPGPARAQFTTIINVPPSPAPSSIGSNTQLNLLAGGLIDADFDAGSPDGTSSNIEVNIFGGLVGNRLEAYSGSTINVFGGFIHYPFEAKTGSIVNIRGGEIDRSYRPSTGSTTTISGGTIGLYFDAEIGSHITLVGGEFRIDGNLIGGLDNIDDLVPFNLPAGSVLSGTLADGTTFAFSPTDYFSYNPGTNGDDFPDGTLFLRRASLPAVGPSNITISTPSGLRSVRQGQTLNVVNGGAVAQNFNAGWGSTINMSGGQFDEGLELVGANLNLTGGTIGYEFDAFQGSQITISGGTISDYCQVLSGSMFTLNAGSIGSQFTAEFGGVADIRGGVVGSDLTAGNGGVVNIFAGSIGTGLRARDSGELYVRGGSMAGGISAYDEGTVHVSSGTFAWGASISSGGVANISGGTFKTDSSVSGAGVANISGGTFSGYFRVRDQSIANISGGTIQSLEITNGASATITGGNIGNVTVSDSPLEISGGNISGIIASDSPLEISGGSVLQLIAETNSRVDILGGSVGVIARDQSIVNIAGGSQRTEFRTDSDSQARLMGGEFRLNGQMIPGLDDVGSIIPFNLPAGALITGILSDGTPFEFSTVDGDTIADGTLILESAALPAIGPEVINITSATTLNSIRAGQTLVLNGGGKLPDQFHAASGSTLIINSGSIGPTNEGEISAVGTTILFNGGSLSSTLHAFNSRIRVTNSMPFAKIIALKSTNVEVFGGAMFNLTIRDNSSASIRESAITFAQISEGSTLDLVSGSLGQSSFADTDSSVNLLGGTVGTGFDAKTGSRVFVSGGSVGSSYDAFTGSVTSISGGSMGNDYDAESGSTTNLFGKQFILGGLDITSTLTPDVPFAVTTRNALLTGLLADGSPFDFDLRSTNSSNRDYFHMDASLTITLVSGIPGDYNSDGTVNAADYTVWRNALGTTVAIRGKGGDGNFDGQVTQADYFVWKAHFGQSSSSSGGTSLNATVPEPASVVLFGLAAISLLVVGRRRSRYLKRRSPSSDRF